MPSQQVYWTDYLLTNEVKPCNTATTEQESSIRWKTEQFHRELKQLTGIQACQCRLARNQRDHITLAVRACTRLKQVAYQTKQPVHQPKQGFLDEYMQHELI